VCGILVLSVQYSLQWFTAVYLEAIVSAEATDIDDIATRCKNINHHFIRALFTRVSRSLYQRHKETFAFLTTCKLLLVCRKLQFIECLTTLAVAGVEGRAVLAVRCFVWVSRTRAAVATTGHR
jgi:hypothetical protein